MSVAEALAPWKKKYVFIRVWIYNELSLRAPQKQHSWFMSKWLLWTFDSFRKITPAASEIWHTVGEKQYVTKVCPEKSARMTYTYGEVNTTEKTM